MAKHILFCIHGMGEHDKTWQEAGLKVLKSAFDEYPLLKKNLKFDDVFDVVPLLYSDEFDQLRERWATDLGAVKQALGNQLEADDTSERQRLERKMDDIAEWAGGGGDTFFATHAMDVLLYRFFKTVRMNVHVQIADQILAKLTKAASTPSWSVLAHSMGTAVVHNTLHAMYESKLNGHSLRVEDTRPRVIAMVANVGRVLQLPALPVYKSRVQPGSVLARRCCMFYLNIRHRLDPFTVPKPFDPDSWPDPKIFNSRQYQHIRPSHFLLDKPEQVHDFDHYLRNPRVNGRLFQTLLGEDLVPDSDIAAAIATFDAQVVNDATDALRDAVEALLPARFQDWRAIVDDLKALRK